MGVFNLMVPNLLALIMTKLGPFIITKGKSDKVGSQFYTYYIKYIITTYTIHISVQINNAQFDKKREHIDGLVQYCSNSSALAMELL